MWPFVLMSLLSTRLYSLSLSLNAIARFPLSNLDSNTSVLSLMGSLGV